MMVHWRRIALWALLGVLAVLIAGLATGCALDPGPAAAAAAGSGDLVRELEDLLP